MQRFVKDYGFNSCVSAINQPCKVDRDCNPQAKCEHGLCICQGGRMGDGYECRGNYSRRQKRAMYWCSSSSFCCSVLHCVRAGNPRVWGLIPHGEYFLCLTFMTWWWNVSLIYQDNVLHFESQAEKMWILHFLGGWNCSDYYFGCKNARCYVDPDMPKEKLCKCLPNQVHKFASNKQCVGKFTLDWYN